MTGLSAEDKVTLTAHFWGCCITPDASQLTDLIAPAVEQLIARHLEAFKAEAVAAIEARMGRDADYDDGMEDAAHIVRYLTP
ncbi:hypothetical protein LRP67_16425 [Nocardioides sp. cx-169]|uniref:hypothetical protein n=1 Tax=Nocardioides sp. cx-169 TaxID=2899080 RepID=UPI001E3A04B2|nr:hypothetical protein [Nocardioides sp. cx-169]MCD4535680.1 hypothetical protein [Nocardioides sp. cx-169]